MSRIALPFHADDISALARSLRQQWAERSELPSHLELLNQLVRAVGYRNFQHFKAEAGTTSSSTAVAALELPAPKPGPVDDAKIKLLLRYFDDAGLMSRWPTKFSHQEPCLWVIWSRLPARQTFSEREINPLIKAEHSFGDHVLLRRELVNYGLLRREPDGSVYQRVERQPSMEIQELIRRLQALYMTEKQ